MTKSKFVEDDPSGDLISLCVRCRHKDLDAGTCKAFTGGIPAKFLDGTEEHRVSTGDDDGIVFEPVEEE